MRQKFEKPQKGNPHQMPIKTLCPCFGGQTGTITKQNLVEMNRSFKLANRNYFFAQDLTQCP